MAEYSPWRLPLVTLAPASTPSPGAVGEACPIFYPVDERAFRALQDNPSQIVPPSPPSLWAPSPTAGFGPETPTGMGASGGVFVAPEDSLRLQAWGDVGSLTVTFYGRQMHPDGTVTPFSFPIVIDGTNAVFEKTFVPSTSTLLNITASVPSGTALVGIISAKAELGRVQGGVFTPHTLLFFGQLSGSSPVSAGGFGGGGNGGGGCGFCGSSLYDYSATGTATTLSITVPVSAGRVARVTNIQGEYTTSAVVGKRYIFVAGITQGRNAWFSLPGAFMPEGQHGFINCSLNAQGASVVDTTAGVNDQLIANLPESFWFQDEFIVRGIINTSFAGDQFTNLDITVEERVA